MRAVKRVLVRIRDAGVAGQPSATVRRIRALNVVTLITIVLSCAYALFYVVYDARLFHREIIVLAITIALFSTVFLAIRAGLVELAMWLLIATALAQLGVVDWLLGPDAGALSYLLATPFLATLVARAGDRFTIWPVAIGAIVIHFVVSLRDKGAMPIYRLVRGTAAMIE